MSTREMYLAFYWLCFRFQYKCGFFFKNLPGRVDVGGAELLGDTLTWIGALPDLLRKKKVINSPEIQEGIGNLRKEDFQLKGAVRKKCKDERATILANARCYAAVSKI